MLDGKPCWDLATVFEGVTLQGPGNSVHCVQPPDVLSEPNLPKPGRRLAATEKFQIKSEVLLSV